MDENEYDLARRISAMLFGHLAERGVLNNAHLCRAVVGDVLTLAKTLTNNYVDRSSSERPAK
jgi:hypothetical protein